MSAMDEARQAIAEVAKTLQTAALPAGITKVRAAIEAETSAQAAWTAWRRKAEAMNAEAEGLLAQAAVCHERATVLFGESPSTAVGYKPTAYDREANKLLATGRKLKDQAGKIYKAARRAQPAPPHDNLPKLRARLARLEAQQADALLNPPAPRLIKPPSSMADYLVPAKGARKRLPQAK